jgi:methylase of polypeptide subunit release factors
MIISNPPYIPKDQLLHCDRGIFHEPSLALFVDPPLKFYSEIIQRAIKGWLKTGGYLVFECSPFNVDQIQDLFIKQSDNFEKIEIRFDTNQLPRVISAKKIVNYF